MSSSIQMEEDPITGSGKLILEDYQEDRLEVVAECGYIYIEGADSRTQVELNRAQVVALISFLAKHLPH